MPELPLISTVLTVPGFTLGASQVASASPQPGDIVSVGLVVDNERVAWGVCPLLSGGPLSVDTTINSIQQTVAPALQGERLASFRELAAKVEALTETVTITETLPEPEGDNQASKFSRRDLFTGRLWSTPPSEEPAPRTREISVQRSLLPAIRYGVSQALLAAVAMAQNKRVAETVVAEYNLPAKPISTVAIHVSAGPPSDEAITAVDTLLSSQVASLGYTIAGSNDKAQMGSNGERLQQYVRRLQTQIAAAETSGYQPVIHLDVRGGLGRLFDNDPGKILGALFGLEQAAKPYLVRVVDPVIMDSRQGQIETLRQLKEYLRLRRMRLQLVASAWIDSAEDVDAFVQSEAVQAIQLNAPQLGSLHRTIEAILACRERGITSLLAGHGGDDGYCAQILAHVALATQPDLIVAPESAHGFALLHNEMARTLAWLSRNSGFAG
ncbi:MAG TPA: hypothetical protein VF177_15040 [Anaerolineae bacterium]